MKNFRILALLAIIFALNVPSALAEYTPKVDSFDFFIDASSSMKDKNSELDMKNSVAVRTLLSKINSMIPNIPYEASMHTFSEVQTIVPYNIWSKADMEEAIKEFDFDSNGDGMGDGFLDVAPDFYKMATPAAVILFSDGETNSGVNPITEVRMLYEVKPDLCVHVVSFADSVTGQALLDEIAGLKPCSISVNAKDLLASDQLTEQFVKDVFYYDASDILVLRGVNFAFDSSVLDANAKAILDEAAPILMASSKKIILTGWTDSTGSEAYNLGLSDRRAMAVKKYLMQKGIAEDRLFVEGKGISHKFDNGTKDGRYMNRRTEVSF